MANLPSRVLVIGAGAWGTAMAIHLARRVDEVLLWGRDETRQRALAEERVSPRLPGIEIPGGVMPIHGPLAELSTQVALVMLAVPARGSVHIMRQLASWSDVPPLGAVLLCKGLEADSRRTFTAVAEDVLGGSWSASVLSGPSFAAEVARGVPTAVVIASGDEMVRNELRDLLHTSDFRTYVSDDVIGVEIGGAIKNVLAIAVGIADGLGYGANTRAALITRGLAEIARLVAALGGRGETVMGLAGLGDLVLTATDDQSRNRRFGLALGRGLSLDAARAEVGATVEGVDAAHAIAGLAGEMGIELPVTEQVAALLDGRTRVEAAVQQLLQREVGMEAPSRH